MKNKTKLKKNDLVIVISGKDRGRQGKILRILPAKGRAQVHPRRRVVRTIAADGGYLGPLLPVAAQPRQFLAAPQLVGVVVLGEHRGVQPVRFEAVSRGQELPGQRLETRAIEPETQVEPRPLPGFSVAQHR